MPALDSTFEIGFEISASTATADVDFTLSPSTSIDWNINGFINCPGVYFPPCVEDEDERLAREYRERITSYRKALYKTKVHNNHLVNEKINHQFNQKKISKRSWNGKGSIYR